MINPVHVHLMLNHVPVLGIGFSSLLLGYSLLRDKAELRKTALVLFILLALITPIVTLSGHGAEESVEKLAGVAEQGIETHEETALVALVLVETLGGLALALAVLGILPAAAGLRRKITWATFALSLFASAWLVWTAATGGKIRHAEELGVGDSAVPGMSAPEKADD